MDCQAAKRFFAEHDVEMDLRDVSAEERVREEMMSRFGRVGTPAIVIGQQVYWGFVDNRQDIADALGLPAETPAKESGDGS